MIPPPDLAAAFIQRWSGASSAERANYALFLSELCDVLEVPRPEPATDESANNAYVFERAVNFHHRGSDKTTTGRIDLYKRGCFVLEAKQYATVKDESADLALDLGDTSPKSTRIARGTAARTGTTRGTAAAAASAAPGAGVEVVEVVRVVLAARHGERYGESRDQREQQRGIAHDPTSAKAAPF